MARQPMTALEWVWYMPPNVQASSDGHWRIYKGRKYRSKSKESTERWSLTPTYSLLRMMADGAMKCVYHAWSAEECKAEAAAQDGQGDANL